MCRNVVSLAIAAVILCGCGRSSAPTKVATTQLITSFGTNHDPVTGWTVTVSETNGIHIGPRTRTTGVIIRIEVNSTMHPPDWKAHPGWFAFAENEERVWMFDGERELLMLNSTPDVVSIKGKPHQNYPVPAEVAERLPESLKKEIPAAHGSKQTPPAP